MTLTTILLLTQLSIPSVVDREPTKSERVDMVLMVGSISASSIALGLTMSCTATGDCVELNPVMHKIIGDSPTKAVVFKSVASGFSHYTIWRLSKGKTRKILLTTLLAFNVWDAAHDIRQMRKIKR